MGKLVCLRHPKYQPGKLPELACETCCNLYLHAQENAEANSNSRRSSEFASSEMTTKTIADERVTLERQSDPIR